MPLSQPVEREHLHSRAYDFRGYRRQDGLWDIEGRMTDTKTYAFPNDWRGVIEAGEPVHDMSIRLVIDDDFLVRDIELATDAGPFRICPDILPAFAAIKGQRIASGWHRRIKDLFGGVHGCTHQVEMLGAMGTVAYQTLFAARQRRRAEDEQAGRRPALLDSCHALASDGEVVKKFWPAHYTGG